MGVEGLWHASGLPPAVLDRACSPRAKCGKLRPVTEQYDRVVVGAGLTGLQAALAAQRAAPGAPLLVVDAAPQPGGGVATQRSNGFVCELGPFAFTRDELVPLLELLVAPPPLLPAQPAAAFGAVFRAGALERIPVDPEPVACRTGNEELVQACRRQLGAALRLGRAVTAVTPRAAGWTLELGGEVPATAHAAQLLLAVPVAVAAQLLAGLEPALASAAASLQTEPAAFVFLGGLTADHGEVSGYGVLPAEGEPSAVAEAIFCTEAFAQRALPGRCLVRCELTGPAAVGDDSALVATATAELVRWTGVSGPWPFTKVHRFTRPVVDAAHAECRARLLGLAARAPGLVVVGR
jgi:protoporphyrinogen oxidase